MTKKRMSLRTAMSIATICSLLMGGCHYLGSSVPASNVISSGTITDKRVNEASGIATSRLSDDILWINNDSGNPPIIYALNPKGDVLASVKVEGVNNRDWEDIASFEYQGKSYLLLGDVGDNDAKWPGYSFYVIAEPDLKDVIPGSQLKVKPEWSVNFTYPDGKHDCESVAVDLQQKKVLLLSKREAIPELFELPLFATGKVIAKELGKIAPIPRAKHRHLSILELLNFATMPTGMDISPDGTSLVVITYDSAYQYHNPSHLPWLQVMKTQPKEIPLPALKQAEAIGFDRSGRHIYITSEKLPAPLLKLNG